MIMEPSKFFTPEAIATYVVFLAGVVITIIGFLVSRWLSRRKPAKIKVVKVSATVLVNIDPTVKSEISILYKGHPVESLYMTEFKIHNGGLDIVDSVNLKIEFKETTILDVNKVDPIPSRETYLEILPDSLIVRFAYINPQSLYKEKISLRLFSREPLQVNKIEGGGRGWIVEFFDYADLLDHIEKEFEQAARTQNIFKAFYLVYKIIRAYLNVYA
ncbi:MAG: hypothetical protein HZB17_07840 [Chloroflexi bacterium]|nr:hypothetical protein [Chloroflexota bacterium]